MQIPIMMRIILLLFTISRPVSSTIILTDFQQQALAEHNYFRQLHCTGPLKLNSTLNNIAQSYAEYLATNRIFNHSGRAGLGENLWAIFSSGVINTVNGRIKIIFLHKKKQSFIYCRFSTNKYVVQ
jgi:uncharacterized protein YkwD